MPLIAQRETLLVYYFLLEFFSNSKAEEGEKRERVIWSRIGRFIVRER